MLVCVCGDCAVLVVGGGGGLPGVVVAWVQSHGVAEAVEAGIKLFQGQILVPCQGIRVRESGVQLQGPLEELQGSQLVL